MYRQAFPALGLSLESGTEAVPVDGMYHLLLHGEIVESFSEERQARRAYDDVRLRLIQETGWRPESPPPDRAELLRRLRAELDVRAVQAATARGKRASSIKKGGPGR